MRRASGIHSVELIGGLLVLVPIVLYAIDYAVLLFSHQMSTSYCSAACRAAAQGPPSSYSPDPKNTPVTRASTVLKSMAKSGAVIRVRSTVRIKERIDDPIPHPPYGGPFKGSVTIKTRCDVFPPILLPFIPKSVTMYAQQCYPWTYVLPSDYSGLAQITPTAPLDDLGQSIADNAP